ncbi:hypothetical protein RJ639_038350 [Escallonia herrerae]|uniref:BHLH domain-containing protein n=1 Tax=Escallonia herrerae TaxID=1293975 RepID=A0AA89BAQ0_9ASTE|nr:hypothetical protein RJ639_038350 [Escallonia herrerae]
MKNDLVCAHIDKLVASHDSSVENVIIYIGEQQTTMGTEDSGDMRFPHRSDDSILNCPNSLSEKVAGVAMSSAGSMFKPSNRADPFFGSGWDPLISLSQGENFGGSSVVPRGDFSNPAYPVGLENQAGSTTSHLVHYGEMMPKLPCFVSGSFAEMVNSFGLPECGQVPSSGCPPNYPQNKEGGTEKASTNGAHSQEEDGASPKWRRKRRASESHSPFSSNKNAEGEHDRDPSGDSSEYAKEQDGKKQKNEHNIGLNLRGKQSGKQAKDSSNSGEAPKDDYIHVRAKRGQATNSHSLAERVRRERISERMRLLQELVPGCNKITGKAVMLDEIINYVQSLQQQVEFLSMKLATVNPEINIDIERILSKDVLHSRGSDAAILGFGPGLSSSHPYSQGSLPNIASTTQPFHPMPQVLIPRFHDI